MQTQVHSQIQVDVQIASTIPIDILYGQALLRGDMITAQEITRKASASQESQEKLLLVEQEMAQRLSYKTLCALYGF